MIKFLIMDVDGTLTDGKIYMGEKGELFKAFDIKDGCGIKDILPKYNIVPIIITARESLMLKNRCAELGITHFYQGEREKLEKLNRIITDYNILHDSNYSLQDCAYIGDDILDLQCMQPIKAAGGLVGCPLDAVGEIVSLADFISSKPAGNGAVREFIEYLIRLEYKVEFEDKIKAKIKAKIEKAINHIQGINVKALSVGQYIVDDDIYFMVQEYMTRDSEQCRWESHKEYIDIQWILSGQEKIAVADISTLEIEQDYDAEKDVMFWEEPARMMEVILRDNSYIVLYPNNAHKPSVAVGESSLVKKIVVKIKIGS